MCKYKDISDNYSSSQIVIMIDEWVHNARARAMLKRKLLDGVSLETIAEEFDLSTVRTQIIVSKARERLLEHIKTIEKQ